VFDPVALQRELREWVRRLPNPCGVFAANDALAVQMLNACAAENRRVPDEIAVVGVDNDNEICENAQPTLTSVIPDWEQSGHKAASLLDKVLHGRREEFDSETLASHRGTVTPFPMRFCWGFSLLPPVL
jgi:LacI family transcriptional regulator